MIIQLIFLLSGKDYYFITTSSSDDLYRRVGGRCASHHMKVAFKVADNVQHRTTNQPLVNVPRMKLHPLYPPGTTSAAEAEADDEHKDFMYRHQNPSKKRPAMLGNDDFSAPPNRGHPNDVIKHEASRLASITSSSSSAASQALHWNLCAVIILVLKLYWEERFISQTVLTFYKYILIAVIINLCVHYGDRWKIFCAFGQAQSRQWWTSNLWTQLRIIWL